MVLGLLLGTMSVANAQALYTLKGETPAAKYDTERNLKLSVLGFSEDEEKQAVIDAWKAWQENGDDTAFNEVLRQQRTRGYLFTAEVTGYSIKYAHQVSDDVSMLLVIPELKSKDRYMWETPPAEDAPPFTLLQLEWLDEERATLKTSLGTGTRLSDDGTYLQLNEDARVFGELADATPYYLEDS